MEIKGTITYEALSGGFWGIVAEDGRKFRPVDGLPEKFREKGLQVAVRIRPSDRFSIFMWGMEVHLDYIEVV